MTDPVRLFKTVLISAALLICACTSTNRLPAFKQLESYDFNAALPLEQRLADIPPSLLDYLKQLDNRSDYAPYRLSPGERKQLAAALQQLPELHSKAMQQRLVGIYFVSNLSSGGYSDYIPAADGRLYTLLVLNPQLFGKSISAWIEAKESSAFRTDGSGQRLRVECHEKGRSALLYLLLHESAHLLDYAAGCTPYVERDLAPPGSGPASSPFTAGTWADYGRPEPLFDFPERSQMRFYGSDEKLLLPRSSMADLYRRLSLTPFVMLYGSQNWAEDFAESAALSALSRITGKSCTVRVDSPGGVVEFSLLDRPQVRNRLQRLYSGCRKEF